jgi:hypothetical protein
LTQAEQAEIDRLLPIASRVARKVARQWQYSAAELEDVATEHLIDAFRLWDGRGTLDGFCGQWVRWRLLDYVKHRRTIAQIEKPLPVNREFKRRQRTDTRPDDFKRNLTDVFDELPDDMPVNLSRGYSRQPKTRSPLYDLILEETAAAVRHNLDGRDVDILRYRLRGKKCTEIAPLVNLSPRRVQELWADIEKSIRYHATDSKLDADELAWSVLNSKEAETKFLKIFRVI